MARGASDRGAEINRHTNVIAISALAFGEWKVVTDKGEIVCEHVISATGNFARQTGRMVGLNVPVIPVAASIHRHRGASRDQARAKGLPEMGVLRESDTSWYMREEAGGLLLGPYEVGAPACYVDGPSEESEYELFQEDLERLGPYIETAIARVPAFGEVGVKKVYNGAIAYTPDGSPIVGPAPGLKNFWLNEGHSFGVTAAGGAGWQLAEWIVEGEPTVDMLGVDPRRFGPYAQQGYLIEKNEEAYAKVFTVHYPNEERVAARPLRQTPCYDRMKALGAVFGSVYGWERPNFFAPPGYGLSDADLAKTDVLMNENHPEVKPGEQPREKWSFRRSNDFEFIGAECRNVHENVGLQDMSAFAKFEVSGPGAEAWLDRILTNKIPKGIGRVTLTYLLTRRGGVRAEFTLTRTGRSASISSPPARWKRHDYDALVKLMPEDGSVRIDKVTTQYGVLVLAGPRSREVLAKVADIDVSNKAFPWLTARPLSVGAAGLIAMRVNFIGELGYELHHPIEMQNYIFDKLMAAGAEFGIKPFGIRAMDSLRLEKSYKLVGRELSIEYAALESGARTFRRPEEGFPRQGGAAGVAGQGLRQQARHARSRRRAPTPMRAARSRCLKNGVAVGRTTSGGYGWRTGKSIALAMVKPELAKPGVVLEIQVLGEPKRAVVIEDSPYDPENAALRG